MFHWLLVHFLAAGIAAGAAMFLVVVAYLVEHLVPVRRKQTEASKQIGMAESVHLLLPDKTQPPVFPDSAPCSLWGAESGFTTPHSGFDGARSHKTQLLSKVEHRSSISNSRQFVSQNLGNRRLDY